MFDLPNRRHRDPEVAATTVTTIDVLNTFNDASARRHLCEGGGVSNEDILEVLKDVFKRRDV
jgi:hypothetical protein